MSGTIWKTWAEIKRMSTSPRQKVVYPVRSDMSKLSRAEKKAARKTLTRYRLKDNGLWRHA